MLTESVRAYLGQLTTLGVPPPFVILVAATGTKGAYISMRNQAVHGSSTIDHDPLILPEVIAEDESPDVPQLLKPVFDAIWNAGGYPRSPNYDEEGNWKPRSA